MPHIPTHLEEREDTITGESLATPSTALDDFETPAEVPVFPVGGLEATLPEVPELTLTGPEQEAQTAGESLQELNRRLIGESEFRTEQEETQDVTGLTQTQTDLSARLKALQNEALAIPLQLQQESLGRGRTVGGLRPLETGALRQNAIQALSVSSLLEASRGNLTLALDLVDRAVAQKFDPIREEIRVKLANLELIINSPEFTLAERNRANRQAQAERAREAEIARQEEEAREIFNIGVEVAGAGAGADILRQIQRAGSKEQALRIATASGFLKDTLREAQVESQRLGNILTQEKIKSQQLENQIKSGAISGTVAGVKLPTFEEFVKQQAPLELAEGVFGPVETEKTREQLRTDYNALVQNAADEDRENKIDGLSPLARDTFLTPELWFSLTATDKGKIAAEVANAGLDAGNLQQGKKSRLSATQSDDLTQARLAKFNIGRIGVLIAEIGAIGPGLGQFRSANPFDIVLCYILYLKPVF